MFLFSSHFLLYIIRKMTWGYFVWHFHCAVDINGQRNVANKRNYLWAICHIVIVSSLQISLKYVTQLCNFSCFENHLWKVNCVEILFREEKMKGFLENQLQFKIRPGKNNLDGNASLGILIICQFQITIQSHRLGKE